MVKLEEKLSVLKQHIEEKHITIMILGLGSVGTYLLDYLLSRNDETQNIVIVGRNAEKMESDINIVKVGSLIRGLNKSHICMEAGVDFNNVEQIAACIKKHNPDFIVNSSRVYSGLKYGSISWKHLRAYGIWSPLAIKYIRNIMEAVESVESKAIVINTSYSDAVIPWLRTAGRQCPDLGSGNPNHLVPRIKMAVADMMGIEDFWNINVMLATAHFHDVVISKEGHTEGMEQLLKVYYEGKELLINQKEIFKRCKIAMPVDAKRNMMNASSNFEIISNMIDAIRKKESRIFFSPGALGEIGGYPVRIDATKEKIEMYIDETVFQLEDMREANRQSIAFDGIEDVRDGKLVYTDTLLAKVKEQFAVELPKEVDFAEIDDVAEKIVNEIIVPTLAK